MSADGKRILLQRLQSDIPLDRRPFARIGKDIGFSEEEVLNLIHTLMLEGTIRRFGAVLRHRKAGFTHNVMVVWAVPDDACDTVGQILSSRPEVTHCYERTPPFEGKYTIFSMMHFKEDDDPETVIQILSRQTGIIDYKLLRTEREFKKKSMEYF